MRIGIEVTGTQSASRLRGVGRYVHEFVQAIASAESRHDWVFYGEAEGPRDFLPDVDLELIAPDRSSGEHDMTAAMRRLLGTNPDRLDLMLVANPLELRPDMLTPERPVGGPAMAAIVYDLIPLIFSDHYYSSWPGDEFVRRYRRGLDRIRSYDLLLTDSEWTRGDVIERLAYPSDRVRSISAASSGAQWAPADSRNASEDRRVLEALGIDRGFVFSVGAMEYRKNVWGLIDAFSKLSDGLRGDRLLVLTYAMNADEAERVRSHAASRGVGDRLRITDRLDDAALAALYRRCDAFVFPSIYEGFGLPVLEAMRCGSAVLTGRNSSLIEVVGDAGLLADVASSDDLAEKLARLLGDVDERERLKAAALAQAAQFSWEATARAAIDAFDAFENRQLARSTRTTRPKPRVAFFSPFAPKLSGIADYSDRLVSALADEIRIDVFHDQGYVPTLHHHEMNVGCHDHRLFKRLDSARPYDAIVHQLGNSPLHEYQYEMLPHHPAIVTLHDFNLSGFRYWKAMSSGAGLEGFRREMEEYRPGLGATPLDELEAWTKQPGGMAEACSIHDVWLNHRVFRNAISVVVHSPWCARQAVRCHGEFGEKTVVIPFGAEVIHRSPDELAEIRSRYGIPRDAFVVGNFGLIHSTKMNVESLIAFRELARERADALFVFVGPEYDDNAARRAVSDLGIADRVRFLGPKPAAEFVELTAIADLGINLRRPPTNGETSAALIDLIRQGVACIAADVGTFTDYPETVVRKLDWDREGQAGLNSLVLRLGRDAAERRNLGDAAQRYIDANHSWSRAKTLYLELIHAHRRITSSPSASVRVTRRSSAGARRDRVGAGA